MAEDENEDRISDSELISGDDRTVIVEVPAELGPYRLTRMLGRGGMGEVWQAFDSNLERDVAIKLMRRELLANEEAVKRFMREARAVARLNHPNIVQVYTFGDEKGLIYFVMEMVEGDTVGQRIKTVGCCRLEESVAILLQAIEGLGYANARGIIHRDIKPSNLMLTPDFRVKIADFGLAKMLEADTQMTAAGSTMGSPNYMSPEQARGEEADHRSDIYALGISFYQMLTGQLPFTGQTALSVLLKQIHETLPEPDFLKEMCDGRVLNVIHKMTHKDPEQRYQTYGGLAAAIADLAPNAGVRSSAFVQTESMPTPQGVAGKGAAIDKDLTLVTDVSAESTRMDDVANRMSSKSDKASTSRTGIIAGIAALAIAAIVSGIYFLFFREETGQSTIASAIGTSQGSSPTPSPTPLSTVTPAVSPSPAVTAVPTQVGPTPTPMYVMLVTPTPQPTYQAITPVETPVPTPPPTPELIQANFVIVGRADSVPGSTVSMVDDFGQISAQIPIGTRAEFVGRGSNGSYKIGYNGKYGYVAFNDARPEYSGSAVATPVVTVAPSQGPRKLTLRIPGSPNALVDIYTDEKGIKPEGRSLPQGTQLDFMAENQWTYKVMLPDGKIGYIYKKEAQ